MAGKLLHELGRDTRAALLRVQYLLDLRTFRSKERMDRDMVDDGWIVQRSFYQERDVANWRFYWCFTQENYLFIFVDGAETQAEGQAIWNGYTSSTPFPQSDPENPFYLAKSAGIDLSTLVLPRPERIWMMGYSAGGPIGFTALRGILINYPVPPFAEWIGFGCPKVSTLDLMQTSRISVMTHWMNSDDPVPLIPPIIGTWPRITAGLSLFQCQRMERFRGPAGGVSIGLTGVLTPRSTPGDSPVPQTTQIGSWLINQEAGVETPHSLFVYSARLSLAIADLPPSQVVTPVADGPTPQDNTPVREIRRAIAATESVQFTDATRQNKVDVVIPEAEAFKVIKKGRVWYVTFRGTPIAAAPHRKRAHGLARDGNAWLRRLQNEGQVYAGDLANEFQTYLNDASDPLGAFKPIMNVPE